MFFSFHRFIFLLNNLFNYNFCLKKGMQIKYIMFRMIIEVLSFLFGTENTFMEENNDTILEDIDDGFPIGLPLEEDDF